VQNTPLFHFKQDHQIDTIFIQKVKVSQNCITVSRDEQLLSEYKNTALLLLLLLLLFESFIKNVNKDLLTPL
jgi:hypothetical protein